MEAESVLAAFLLDMEDLERVLELEETIVKTEDLVGCGPEPQSDSASGNSSTSRKPVKIPTRKRVGRRIQILALQQELDALTQQRERLNQERLLRKEIARQESAGVCPRALGYWKRQAQLHQITKQCSEQTQEHLIQCIEQNGQRLENIPALLSEQMNGLRANPQLQISDPDENDAYVYRMLKDTLNTQHAQVDAFLAQCVPAFDPACHYESSIHADGAGIDVRSFVISPFHVALINDAIQRYTQERLTRVSFGGSTDGDAVRYISLLPLSSDDCGTDLLRVLAL